MKFKSIMELLPKAQRSHYLSIYGKSDGDILPDPAAPEKIFVQLPALELRLFELIVRRLGCYPFEWNKLVHAVSKQLTEAEIKVAMIGLRKKGVLFTAKKTWGEYSFFIAEDLYPAWHKLVFQKFYEKLSYADHSLFSEGLEMKFGGLLAALFHFVSAAAITGIPLTKQRGIHKRFLCELPQAGMLDSNVLLDVGLEPATSSVLPPAAALMLELAGRLGFVQQEEARLYVDTACLEAWLNRPAAELEWELAERIYLLLMPSDVLLQHSIFILRSLPPERQVTLSSLLDVLAEECGADEAEAICSQQFRAQLETWLRFMQEIGELAYARSGEDILIRRLPPACSSDNTSGIYIQPDFECIVPPDVSYAVRWKLNTIAELLQAEQAWIFKLKREKVEAQLQSGKAADELLRFLRSHAQYGVPENIADAMRQWEKESAKVEVQPAVIVRFQNEADANVFAHACTAEFPCERLNQAMFAVEAEQAQAVEKLLRRLGFRLPQSAGDRGGEPVNSGNSNGVKLPAIVRSLYPDMIYTLETRTPEIEQAYPELKQIPKMWLEKPRSYHHSTCRELLQTAIEWGAYVKFKTETKEALIAPERVRETSGWSVEGRIGNQPITLPLEEWEQFQLILPGINDK